MDTNILLESGTNELEILEFTVSGNYYGINVAKVKEIMTYQPLTPVPKAHPNVQTHQKICSLSQILMIFYLDFM